MYRERLIPPASVSLLDLVFHTLADRSKHLVDIRHVDLLVRKRKGRVVSTHATHLLSQKRVNGLVRGKPCFRSV